MPVKKESSAVEVVEEVGETSKDFKEIRSRCLAEGKLFEDPDFPPSNDKWLRPSEICKNPQFFVDGPCRFDARQGVLGDCWLVAAISNLAQHKRLIYQVVPDDQGFDKDYAGVFHFRFWDSGNWVEVVVDDRLPTEDGGLSFLNNSTHRNEFWSPLLEKAYAKCLIPHINPAGQAEAAGLESLHEIKRLSWRELHLAVDKYRLLRHLGSYGHLGGGWPSTALKAFTGGVSEWHRDYISSPDFYTTLLKTYERNSLIAAVICQSPDRVSVPGLAAGHAYSITGVKCVDIKTPERSDKIRLVRIRNPWGDWCEWTGAWCDRSPEWNNLSKSQKEELGLAFNPDGEFWMCFEDFVKHFSIVEIVNLNPDALDLEECPKECNKKWETSAFEGKWVKGVTAIGCKNSLESFSRSPQYTVTLTDPDEGDDETKCTMIVALLQKNGHLVTGVTTHAIGFSVYRLPDNKHVSMPVDISSDDYQCVGRCKDLTRLREATARFKLEPGTYVIVPSTFGPDQEGEFLLRVFSEKPQIMAEHVVSDGTEDHAKKVPADTESAASVRVQ